MKNDLFLFILFASLFFICNPVSSSQYQSKKFSSISSVSQSSWKKLATKNIYFGHQSVGGNIMAGVEDILKQYPQIGITVTTAKGKNIYIFNKPVFLHKAVGKNQDPISKINDFKFNIENKLRPVPDIAFFKFCFVDFDPRTDVEQVFTHYKKTMQTLKNKYPDTVFIHITAPLTCYAPGPSGWIKRGKDFIKKIIGKLNVYDFSSANEFNRKLINEYQGKEPVFDLARFEATYPDGTLAQYKKNNRTYYKLVKQYTSDGGHLNEFGRKIIAEQLLLFLVNLPENH